MSFARLRRLTVLLLSLSLARPSVALAQTNTPALLPPAAQKAVNKGIIAAKLPDYPLAIRYFEEARKLAPAAPLIYLNLGLAESRIPGRELRAIAWFGAYLSAYPDAANAVAVKEQIKMLGVKSLRSLSRLIRIAEDAATQYDEGNTTHYRSSSLLEVAKLWARMGDFETAIQTANGIPWALAKADALWAIAEAQAKAGDIAGAKRMADSLQDVSAKAKALAMIAEAQAKGGDIQGAQKTAHSIQNPASKGYALRSIAEAQAKAGDIAGAQRTADSIQDVYAKDYALRSIAYGQAKAGDIAGAQRTADSIPDTDTSWVASALGEIARAQAEGGDIAGAQRTANRIQSADFKDYALKAIAEAQAKAGDIAGAQRMADSIRDAFWKSEALLPIAIAQANVGDIAGARRTADSIQDGFLKDLGLEAIAAAQAKAGDIPGAQRTADSIREAFWKTYPIDVIVTLQARIDPRNVVAQRSISVWRWNQINVRLLNAAAFLDLGAFLKSLALDNLHAIFNGSDEAALQIADARQVVNLMLKAQTASRATQ